MILNDIGLELIVFISCLMSEMFVKCDEELCQNTAINSVDRFNNNTVRLFRQNDFWDLNGFPDNIKVGVKGSMKDYEFFNPVNKSGKIVTVLEGSPTIRDRTFKFDGLYWWSWYNHPKFGLRYVATSAGLYWDQIPKDHGFNAVFHNGDKKEPMLIGLEFDPRYSDKYMKIHYFSTENETFVRKTSKYFDEKDFPKDLTDAFSWPPTKGLKYMVYLLTDDKYCILTDKQKCLNTEWKSFRQLIGCSGQTKSQPSTPSGQSKPGDRPTEGGRPPGPGAGSGTKVPTGGGTGNRPGGANSGKGDGSGSKPGASGGPSGAKPSPDKSKATPKQSAEPSAQPANELESSTEGGAQTLVFSTLLVVVSVLCFTFL